jgi:nuclease S1
MRFMLIVGLAVVGFSGEAQAWGDEGHKIVCEIAFRLAQPATRAAVRKLIRSVSLSET